MSTQDAELYGDKDEIAAAEIASVKKGAKVYEKKANLFFLSSKETALEHLAVKKSATEELKKHQKAGGPSASKQQQ